MSWHRSARLLFVVVLVGVAVLPPMALGAPAALPPVDGVIASVDASAMVITARNGEQVRITTTADTRIIRRQPVGLETIKPNDLVAVTARREPDGSLTALLINILPPEFRDRFRQAQFPMETGNIMTNAIVFQNVRRVDGRTLYLKMPDGTAVIAVPKNTEIFRLAIIQMSELRPGMRVVVRGSGGADGAMVASTITVDGAR